MQHRQSLGSPSSKLHLHHHGVSANNNNEDILIIADEPPKPHRLSSPPLPLPPHKLIHLIPILTLLCFLVLFLCSHPPSPSDLDHFTGFKRSSHNHHSAVEMSDIGHHYMDAKRSDVLAIRSLQQIPKSRLHRKLADF